MNNKIDCTIDIINKKHHKFIKEDIKKVNFPIDKIKIFPLEPREISKKLTDYDCGLVFIETGDWIKCLLQLR